MLFHFRREMGDTPHTTQYTETGSNLSEESTDVCEQELIVTEVIRLLIIATYKLYYHCSNDTILYT